MSLPAFNCNYERGVLRASRATDLRGLTAPDRCAVRTYVCTAPCQ